MIVQKRYTRKTSKKGPGGQRKKLHEPEDLLSNLPKTVIGHILDCLPLKEAVRTSILSHGWRNNWTNLSELVFDKHAFPRYDPQTDFDTETENIVDRVLLLHQGPVKKLKLSVEMASYQNIDIWILTAARRGMRELILDNWGGDVYKVPSCLYSCNELIYLELFRCKLMPPPSFNGFRNLRTLDLHDVNISTDELDNLLSKCILLVKLSLSYMVGCTKLTISAPNLQNVEIQSSFEDICFVNTNYLAEVSIGLEKGGTYQSATNRRECKLIHLIVCLPSLRRLELPGLSYQILSAGEVPVDHLDDCQLIALSASMNFKAKQHMLTILWIFTSSPNLQELRIKSMMNGNNGDVPIDFWDSQEHCIWSLSHLRILELTECTTSEDELKFIKFVLANAPALELVYIRRRHSVTDVTKFLKELIKFPRISSIAAVDAA